MFKRNLSRVFAILLAAGLTAAPASAFAAETEDVKTVTITDVHKVDGAWSAEYDKEIEEDGVKYTFDGIKYEDDKVERFTYEEAGDKVYQETIIEEDGTEKEVGTDPVEFPEEYTDENGVKYVLKDTKVETETVTDRTATVTLYVERNSTKNGEAPAQMAPVNYIDPDTGSEKPIPDELKSQMLNFKESTMDREYWGNGDYTGMMTFNHYEYTSYDYNGSTIAHNDETPLPASDYGLVITEQGLNPNLFRITNITWAAPEYTDGTTWYRDAVITGDVYNMEYTDTYESVIDVPDITYTVTTAIYEESDESYNERATATAVVTYKKADGKNPNGGNNDGNTAGGKSGFQKILDFIKTPGGIAVTGAVLLAIVAAIVIVLVLKKRKNGKD